MSEAAPDIAAFAERVRTTLPGFAIPGRSPQPPGRILGDLFANDEALKAVAVEAREDFLRLVAADLLTTAGAE